MTASSPSTHEWIAYTSSPIFIGLILLLAYLAHYTTSNNGYSRLSSIDNTWRNLDESSSLTQQEDANTCIGGVTLPISGARAVDDINAYTSLPNRLLSITLIVYSLSLLVGGVSVNESIIQALILVHFLFTVSLTYCAFVIPPTRIFSIVLVLGVDTVASVLTNRLSVYSAVWQFKVVSILPLIQTGTCLLAFGLSVLEYNRVSNLKTKLIPSIRSANAMAPMTLEPFKSLFQALTFSWFTPLIRQGYKYPLELGQVWDLAIDDKSWSAIHQYEMYYCPNRPVWVSVAMTVKWLILYQITCGVLVAFLSLAGPYFLNRLLAYLEGNYDPTLGSEWTPYYYVLGMFLCSLISSFLSGQTYFTGRRVGTRVRAILNSLLFRKSLSRQPHFLNTSVRPSNASDGNQGDTKPSTVNSSESLDINVLVSTDLGRILDYVCYVQYLISMPTQLLLCISALYYLLGWSALVGVAILTIIMPIQAQLGKIMEGQQSKVMESTDARVKKMNEVLHGIRIIKLFAWESAFINTIMNLRNKEVANLRRYWLTMAGVRQLYHGVPTIVTMLTFFTYTGIAHQELSATKVFTSLILFGVLRMPLWDLPDQIIRFFETRVSVLRVQAYLNGIDLVDYTVDLDLVNPEPLEELAPYPIACMNATLRWPVMNDTQSKNEPQPGLSTSDDAANTFAVRDLNIRFPENKLTVILGGTGQGKSTLLHGLLGELDLVSGQVCMPHIPIAYVPQQSWLINDTIRNNILFSSPFDEAWYNQVLKACALTRDLEILEFGDLTQIGERGVALSGGQKQRISLARATYAQYAKIVMLDDVLSAVDAPTATHLFHQCILGQVMSGRTRILVTHNIGLVAPYADHMIYIKAGRAIAEAESMHQLVDVLLSQGYEEEAASVSCTSGSMSKSKSEQAKPETGKTDSLMDLPELLEDESSVAIEAGGVQLNKDEESASGSLLWSVYAGYIEATGGMVWWVILVLTVAIPQLLHLYQDWWLKEWAQQYTQVSNILSTATSLVSMAFINTFSFSSGVLPQYVDSSIQGAESTYLALVHNGLIQPVDLGYYMGVYAGLCALNMVVQSIFAVLEVVITLRGGIKMHNDLLNRVLGSTLTFFDSTPVGRLTNRFSKDQQCIDREVMYSMMLVIWCLISVITVISFVSFISPMFLLFVTPLGFAYKSIAQYYLTTSRELKRLESTTRTPILSLFQEASHGTSVIRAFHRNNAFIQMAHDRMDTHQRPFFALWVSNRWLSIRLDSLSSVVIMACSIAILVSGNLNAGTAGIALSWVLGISESVLWLVRTHAQMEMNLNSVERFQEYMRIEQEPTDGQILTQWPVHGDLTVHNISMRYASSSTPVLSNVTFSVPGRTKVGIVGRTGAGKSSLALALMRMIELESGYVEIDGVRTDEIALRCLRSCVTMVPQDPVLFEGTLRSNLDVLNEHDDLTILNVLYRVHFFDCTQSTTDLVDDTSMSSSDAQTPTNDKFSVTLAEETAISSSQWTLDSHVAAGGKNLSVGQRQLLCLGRALLRSPKILLLDESTANVSHDLDARIQRTIREEFSASTVLCVAHRLRTVCDFDKILVLDQGMVKQFGSPYELMHDTDGIFYHMCQETGDWDHLVTMASGAHDSQWRLLAPTDSSLPSVNTAGEA